MEFQLYLKVTHKHSFPFVSSLTQQGMSFSRSPRAPCTHIADELHPDYNCYRNHIWSVASTLYDWHDGITALAKPNRCRFTAEYQCDKI